ncbi:MAG: ABC transporter permease, partial [Saprospiraceae bacterium]
MLRYILKRILIFIPTLFVISLVIYFLSVFAPGDPVNNLLDRSQGGEGNQSDKIAGEEAYIKMRKKLNLDLPVFYFTIATQADCDTLHKIQKQAHRETLARMTRESGNWEKVSNYYHTLRNYEDAVFAFEADSTSRKPHSRIKENISKLYINHTDVKLNKYLTKIDDYLGQTDTMTQVLGMGFEEVKTAYNDINANATTWKSNIPAIHCYGMNNRYHKWIFGIIKFDVKALFPWKDLTLSQRWDKFINIDLGISYQDQLPIADKIGDRIFWTMLVSLLSIILTYLLAIPLGVFSATNKGEPMDNFITTILFILYSLPNFWIATLLINYLCNPEYLHLFPAFGVGAGLVEGQSFITQFFIRAQHLVLPLICWTYGSLAFLSRQMRGGMLGVLRQDYIRTA